MFVIPMSGHQIILSGTICGTELLEAATTHPSTLVMRRCHFDILLKDIESSIFLLGSYLKVSWSLITFSR